MRRRYDMRRSDNFPFTGKMKHTCEGDGSIFVYTGFPVQSVSLVPINLPTGTKISYRTASNDIGFFVDHVGVPTDPGIIEFSFMAQ